MKKSIAVFLTIVLCLSLASASTAEQSKEIPAVGSIITFGSYEQDEDLTNGAEPIRWIVLEQEGNKLMLLSQYCLETRQFYPERIKMNWARSTLRVWMNEDFYNAAFTPEEQAAILTTSVTHENPHGLTGGKDDTLDKIYLLSKEEVLHYYPEQADRCAYPTEHAKAQGCTVDPDTGTCRWWLRTPGARPLDMYGIRIDGRVTAYGMQDVDWPTNTVRPVMWITWAE